MLRFAASATLMAQPSIYGHQPEPALMPKDTIIEALGERQLLVPGMVAAALSANDRVKYLLTLLQTARSAAEGTAGIASLREERLASGVDEAGLDRVVGDSVRRADGSYLIPGAGELSRRAIREVRTMLAPLDSAAVAAARALGRRVQAVEDALDVEGDVISGSELARLTAGRPDGGDSLHLVVMDAHRELNALEASLARESVDGTGLTGTPFPQDPLDQLVAAVDAVLDSVDDPKAREYRRLHGISRDMGTAVILQRMVFGNAGGLSGAGVGFTRDPALGERRLYIDFLLDAQGEDIVGGRQTAEGLGELAVVAPDIVAEIERVSGVLEAEFADTQEFELTVQEGELFLLQTRTAKRTPWAALRIATDQVREGLISREAALERLAPLDLDEIRRVHVKAPDGAPELARGTPASVGVGTGPLALDRRAAQRFAGAGTPPVLVRPDTSTEDVPAVAVAAGVLTAAGGRTAHAAVVARELGKPCLVGCAELEIDLEARTARIGDRVLAEGEVACVDAEAGRVFLGAPELVEERPVKELEEVAAWLVGAGQPERSATDSMPMAQETPA